MFKVIPNVSLPTGQMAYLGIDGSLGIVVQSDRGCDLAFLEDQNDAQLVCSVWSCIFVDHSQVSLKGVYDQTTDSTDILV